MIDQRYLDKIEENRGRFCELNAIKFNRFQGLLPANIKRVINFIPFMLSINHPKLPGYVEGEVPVGIVDYAPDEETRKYVKAKFPSTRVEVPEGASFIHMLAVMGSVGTIAYNKKSDFDYWVCIDMRSVPADMLARFKRKVEEVQRWASAEAEVSVHLFVNDITRVKQNVFAEDEDEAFGSTIGEVLKDEFFRSSIIIAGRIPFWWVLPNFLKNSDYERLFAALPPDAAARYVDLGNLYKISREDFLGAALFQIIKSLGNPFKSILKLGVLEKYLFGQEESPILSQKMKMNVLRGNFDNNIIDSYLLMFKEVFDYYSATLEDKKLLEVLKQNLYLKVDPQISKYLKLIQDRREIPYKVEVMVRYCKDWGWDRGVISDLDNFENWEFGKTMAFWDSVKKFMLLSYQRIVSRLPTLNLKDKISESDFMLLSRKIKTHFRKERDKIEQLITFKDTPSEPILYIEPASQGVHELEWRLFKRNRSEENVFITTTIATEKDLLKLLAWTALNQIYDPVFTRLNIQSGYTRVNQNMAVEFVNAISNFFKPGKIRIRNEYFLNEEFRLLNLIILNFNLEGADAIKTVHHLYHTSWDESYLKEYEGEVNIPVILAAVLRDGVRLGRPFDDYCAVIAPEIYKKAFKRVQTIFRESYAAIVERGGKGEEASARFITRIGEQYVMVTRDGAEVNAQTFPSYAVLLAAKTLNPKPRMRYVFFDDEGPLAALDALYRMGREHHIVMAYEERGEAMLCYVIDENGNLFSFIRPTAQRDEVLVYLYGFCRSVLKRLKASSSFSLLAEGNILVHRLAFDKFGKFTVSDESINVHKRYIVGYSGERSIAVQVARHLSDETFYNVLFPDGVSSGFMSTGELYAVSDRIRKLRQAGHDLATCVRDITFTDLTDAEAKLGSTIYLLEKYKLESVIEKGLRQM